MSEFLRKYKNLLIIVAAIIITLTAVFFLADGPEIKKNNPTVTGSVSSASGIVLESHDVSYSSISDTYISETQNNSEVYTSSFSENQISAESGEAVSESLPENSLSIVKTDSSLDVYEVSTDNIYEEISQAATEQSSVIIPEQSSEITVEESSETSNDEVTHKCTFSINCSVLNDHIDGLAKNKRPLVPSDGVILSDVTVEFSKGESVFDITKRICKENRIHFEFTMTPIYNTAYIEGIYNLYEFDCGSASGWVYSVNEKIPSYGCSDYTVRDGDKIIWHYTCALGNDIVF